MGPIARMITAEIDRSYDDSILSAKEYYFTAVVTNATGGSTALLWDAIVAGERDYQVPANMASIWRALRAKRFHRIYA